MNAHNTDFGFIALNIARIARVITSGHRITFSMSFDDKNGDYIIVAIYENNPLKCLRTFFGHEYENPRDFCNDILAYCKESNLIITPMNIEIID